MRRRPEGMQRRTTLGEQPLGTRKRGWDAGSFCTRGLEKGRAELRVTVLAYNLRRVRNSVGMAGRMAALGGVWRVVGRAALAGDQETRTPERGTEMPTKTRAEAASESG